jgi:uncharacterized membrane protein
MWIVIAVIVYIVGVKLLIKGFQMLKYWDTEIERMKEGKSGD